MGLQLHYHRQMPILELQNLYERKFRAHAADPRYNPHFASMADIDVKIDLPHMLSEDKELQAELESVLRGLTRQMMYEIGKRAGAFVDRQSASKASSPSPPASPTPGPD